MNRLLTQFTQAVKDTAYFSALSAVADKRKRATLRMAMSEGVEVDFENGIIRNVAVITAGPAKGHGFDLDKTSLQQVCDIINGNGDGSKSHFKHPEVKDGTVEDQLGELVGRLKNCRIEGDAVRGDVYLGEYAKCTPKNGDLWTYLLTIAKEDPAAIGLSAVLYWEPDEKMLPDKIVARVFEVYQVDFVGDPAANPNGLLARKASLAATSENIGVVLAAGIEACNAAISTLRTTRDALAAMNDDPATVVAVTLMCGKAGAAAQAVTLAARDCIDASNAVVRGTLLAKEVGDAASLFIRLSRLVRDECSDVLNEIDWMGWGTSDLSRAASAAIPLLRTCLKTAEQAQDSSCYVTAPMSCLAAKKNAAADRTSLKVNKVRAAHVLKLVK